MTTSAIRAALERLVELDDAASCVADRYTTDWAAAIAVARAALAEPVGEGPSDRIVSIAKAVQECAFAHESDARLIGNVCAEDVADLCDAVIDRRARPVTPAAPEVASQPCKLPEPGEAGELVGRLGWIAAQLGDIGWSDDSASVARAATLLQQRATPAPVVVPVADDRDPGCVACWPECVPGGYDPRCCRFPKSCSCAHAIPLPQGGEMDERLARWSRPAVLPVPEVEEVEELVEFLHALAAAPILTAPYVVLIRRAATLLEQRGAPAPAVVSVAVSERLPDLRPESEGGDCDAWGRCWWFSESHEGLDTAPVWALTWRSDDDTHWRPFRAIPLPQGGEVEA